MIRRQYAWLLVAAAALLGSLAPAGATMLDPVSPQQLVREAELIFEGVVTAVEYRLSDVAAPDHVALPHTFVTFAIAQSFKGGTVTGHSITLRFRGGPDGNGKVMMIPGIPLFDVGDRDILSVRGNGAHPCPLVGWEQGRFRLINGDVYTERGQEVLSTDGGEFVLGSHHALEEVVTHNLAGTMLRFAAPSPQATQAPLRGTQRLDAASFKTLLAGFVEQLHTPEQLAGLMPVASTDIQDPFYVMARQPGAPPAVPAIVEGHSPEGEQGPLEEEQPRQRDGDPAR